MSNLTARLQAKYNCIEKALSDTGSVALGNIRYRRLIAFLSFHSKVKVKVKSSTCYSASYTRRTEDQRRFTILEVAADWHELMIPQRTMRPSIARVNEQLDPQIAASRHTIAPISHTRPSPRSP